MSIQISGRKIIIFALAGLAAIAVIAIALVVLQRHPQQNAPSNSDEPQAETVPASGAGEEKREEDEGESP